MKNKKVFAIASLVLALIPIIFLFFDFSSLDTFIILSTISIVIEIVAVVFGIIGKSSSKGLSISGIVIGIIVGVFFALTLFGSIMMKNAKDCVEKENGISICIYAGQEIEIPTELLTEEQMKKEEE